MIILHLAPASPPAFRYVRSTTYPFGQKGTQNGGCPNPIGLAKAIYGINRPIVGVS